MGRKNSHSGLMVQLFVLLLFIPAVIIIGGNGSKTSAVRSSFAMVEPPGSDPSSKLIDQNESLNRIHSETSSPTDGPGGPILVISSVDNPFSRYTVEILRAEGLNEFAVEDNSVVTTTLLEKYDVVILGEIPVDKYQVAMFSRWVDGGGTLIAFKPDQLLLPLLGLSPVDGILSDKYLLVNTETGPGAGIVDETIQFHGAADLYALNGAMSIADLYSSATMPAKYPAVTTMNVGENGGKAIAFAYDLPRSIVYTRQGNPQWAGQKRDGEINPIRSDDLFFPNWIDFDKVAIPQADEQQRLLANIILLSNLHRKPLPRFWYLPRDLKAAIIMTGDNHTTNGTTGRFYQYLTLGPNTAQDVADWNAVRATSYIYPDMPITDEQAKFFQEQGFEISLHTNTGCEDYTPSSLKSNFREDLKRFALSYPDVSAPVTNRSHCLNWSDWSSTPKAELHNGIRLDATYYYYWPQAWMKNHPGMFTGSGMPMRFADADGSLIDVYQVPTQMTDETNMNYSVFCNELLDKAIGPEAYYGVFCANMHTDHKFSEGSDAIIASALARGVPVISAKQMLSWLDGRNNSFFGNITWHKEQLSFSITAHNDAYNLRSMLPLYSETGELTSVTCNGDAIPFTIQKIKGIEYAFFSPSAGTNAYVANYSIRKNGQKRFLSKTQTGSEKAIKKLTEEKLYINAVPNPAISNFNLVLNSNDAGPVTVRISDPSGNLIEAHEKIASTGILRMGDKWKAGTYIAEIIQGDQRKSMKIVKVK